MRPILPFSLVEVPGCFTPESSRYMLSEIDLFLHEISQLFSQFILEAIPVRFQVLHWDFAPLFNLDISKRESVLQIPVLANSPRWEYQTNFKTVQFPIF